MDNIINDNSKSLKQKLKEINKIKPWYHNICVNGLYCKGEKTPPARGRNYEAIINELPESLNGMTVLDIGCAEGAFSIEAKKRGALRVDSYDYSEDSIKKAKFLAKEMNLDINYNVQNVKDLNFLNKLDSYDYIIFVGVFYHIGNEMVPSRLAKLFNKKLIFETTETTLVTDRPIIELNTPIATKPGTAYINKKGMDFLMGCENGKAISKLVFRGGRICCSYTKKIQIL